MKDADSSESLAHRGHSVRLFDRNKNCPMFRCMIICIVCPVTRARASDVHCSDVDEGWFEHMTTI